MGLQHNVNKIEST